MIEHTYLVTYQTETDMDPRTCKLRVKDKLIQAVSEEEAYDKLRSYVKHPYLISISTDRPL